jgi:hypothetical protein
MRKASVREFQRRLGAEGTRLHRTVARTDEELATRESHQAGELEHCGTAIPLARLRALPIARYCLTVRRSERRRAGATVATRRERHCQDHDPTPMLWPIPRERRTLGAAFILEVTWTFEARAAAPRPPT